MEAFIVIAAVGFVAQLIDGAIGMAFGIVSMSALLAVGYGPAAASAIVHVVKIGSGIASGTFHARFGNVDARVMLIVAVPGAIGAFVGAVLLSSVDLTSASPWTAALLMGLGALVLIRFSGRGAGSIVRKAHVRWLAPLGLVGGFVDATGGGGWGPIVTTSLTASNAFTPRRAIGTANAAEAIVALAASVGFIVGLGASGIDWAAVLVLLAGALLAAPLAAKLVSVAPQRLLGLATGGLVLVLSARQLSVSLGAPTAIVITAVLMACAGWVVALVFGWLRHRSEATNGLTESSSAGSVAEDSGQPAADD